MERLPTGAARCRFDQDLLSFLTLDNPARAAAERFGTTGESLPQTLVGCVRDGGDLLVPLGVPGLRKMGRADWSRTDAPTLPLPASCRLVATSRFYQQRAVFAARDNWCGVIVMPPGAGKTVTALAIVDDLRLRPLVLVHTKDLMAQWLDSARTNLGVWFDHVGGDLPASYDPPDGVMTCGTVVMIQTLATWPRADTERLAAAHGVAFLDEAHHAPAASFFRTLWGVGCARRYALTATPERPDGLTAMLHWCFGPEISRTTHDELQRAGVSVRPLVRKVDTSFDFDLHRRVVVTHDAPTRWAKTLRWKSPTFDEVWSSVQSLALQSCKVTARMLPDSVVERLVETAKRTGWFTDAVVDSQSLADCMKTLCQDPVRIALAAQLVYDLVHEGRQTLVLAGRVDHCQRIVDACEALGVEAKVLTGKMSAKKRGAVLDELRSGDLRVCVSTTLADEGLDVPTLSGMVNAFPGRAAGKTAQRAGRLMRPHPDVPRPVLLDMVDSLIPLFKNQWFARRRAYKSNGCEVVA